MVQITPIPTFYGNFLEGKCGLPYFIPFEGQFLKNAQFIIASYSCNNGMFYKNKSSGHIVPKLLQAARQC